MPAESESGVPSAEKIEAEARRVYSPLFPERQLKKGDELVSVSNLSRQEKEVYHQAHELMISAIDGGLTKELENLRMLEQHGNIPYLSKWRESLFGPRIEPMVEISGLRDEISQFSPLTYARIAALAQKSDQEFIAEYYIQKKPRIDLRKIPAIKGIVGATAVLFGSAVYPPSAPYVVPVGGALVAEAGREYYGVSKEPRERVGSRSLRDAIESNLLIKYSEIFRKGAEAYMILSKGHETDRTWEDYFRVVKELVDFVKDVDSMKVWEMTGGRRKTLEKPLKEMQEEQKKFKDKTTSAEKMVYFAGGATALGIGTATEVIAPGMGVLMGAGTFLAIGGARLAGARLFEYFKTRAKKAQEQAQTWLPKRLQVVKSSFDSLFGKYWQEKEKARQEAEEEKKLAIKRGLVSEEEEKFFLRPDNQTLIKELQGGIRGGREHFLKFRTDAQRLIPGIDITRDYQIIVLYPEDNRIILRDYLSGEEYDYKLDRVLLGMEAHSGKPPKKPETSTHGAEAQVRNQKVREIFLHRRQNNEVQTIPPDTQIAEGQIYFLDDIPYIVRVAADASNTVQLQKVKADAQGQVQLRGNQVQLEGGQDSSLNIKKEDLAKNYTAMLASIYTIGGGGGEQQDRGGGRGQRQR